ncbi:MAG: DAK2 domain-containing protein [Candidatus Dormibacteria bacterium]
MGATEPEESSTPAALSGERLRSGLERGLRRLAEERERLNQLNVFPVPDGDTGTNMHLTVEAAVAEVSRLGTGAGVEAVSRSAAHGALMGARGNSGVILSQVLRGFAQGCSGREELSPKELAQALDLAARVAYAAVKRPVEGTILGVSRAAAQAAAEAAEGGADLAALLEAVVAEAWSAVERSREQLEALRRAKVVDAGGFGLALILTALAEMAVGHHGWPVGLAAADPGPAGGAARHGVGSTTEPEGGFGYCTEFILEGAEVDPLRLRAELGDEAEDDSALVVGEPGLVHVHIHTETPWVLLQRVSGLGQIQRLKVEDMTAQHHQARERGQATALTPLAVVAVASGPGFRELLEGLGAVVVEAAAGGNLSPREIAAGVAGAGAGEVLLLPNHQELLAAAEEAAGSAAVPTQVVASTNLPQGIAALLAFDPEGPLEVNRRRMERALGEVHAIEIRLEPADAPPMSQRVTARLDGQPAGAGADLAEVVWQALRQLGQGALEVVTLYRGAGASREEAVSLAQAIRQRLPNVEVEVHDGGQPGFAYVISAE